MSELRNVIAGTITDRQSYTGDQVKNLRTGLSFTAELEEIQDIELNTDLGRDARESLLVHVSASAAADGCQMGDRLQVTLYGQLATLQILRRQDNPVTFQTQFGCMKITSVDT